MTDHHMSTYSSSLSRTVLVVTCGLSQLLGMSLEKLLLTSFGTGLGPTLQDATGLLGCRERQGLILHPEMNYFSLTSKAVLHASFLRVMGELFSRQQWTGAGETFLPFMQQLAEESTCRGSCCLVCCYFCFSLSAVVTGVAFTGC